MCLSNEYIEDILKEVLLEEAGQMLLDAWFHWAWEQGFWQNWRERNENI